MKYLKRFFLGLPINNSSFEARMSGKNVLKLAQRFCENNLVDITNLEAGFYVCRILFGTQVINRNFVKL